MTKLNSEIMGRMLTRVTLKGLIGEAPLIIDEAGNGIIQAIDYSGSFVVSCQGKVINDAIDSPIALGLCNLKMLCQFFQGAKEQIAFVVKDEWLTLRHKTGRVKTLLQSIETLPTKVDSPVTVSMFTEKSTAQFTIDQQFFDALSYYVGLVGSNSIVFTAKNGQLTIRSNEHDEQQFVFQKAAQVEPKTAMVSSELFTNQLMPILEVALATITPENILTVHMGDSTPLVVEDPNGFWALMPIVA